MNLKKQKCSLRSLGNQYKLFISLEKYYILDESEVEDSLDDTQILFLRGAMLTNTYTTYEQGVKIMKYALAKLMEEYTKPND